ncbi:hypothetical protein [Mycolicibacterium arenosum]|uniref:DUF222 domain-containing protein n=1 Tax=Mycolicibacterium arenosum TaxID=2952157 RepID=A0ABT1M5I2_9MYCO|nr:hypothetical protein [Mycolicibacterium sp. CAU 1645]MCP9274072.1 hypothetical protein [Mycolicibacterium sp. CAU 1645]
MTERRELLDYASKVLDGDYGLGVRATRTAALLARRAFEDWLDEKCADWSTDVNSDRPPATTSKLVALGALHGEELGERAKVVWHGLSRAVHLHAYELAPSVAEVRLLVSRVEQLAG